MTEGYEGQRADPDKDAGAQFAVLVRLQTIGQDDDVDTDCVKQEELAVAQSEKTSDNAAYCSRQQT